MREGFTFDDVLILPQFSNINSRKDVDTSVLLGGKLKLKLPIISSNMETITGVRMAKAITGLGGMAILHRFWDVEDNVAAFEELLEYDKNCVNTVGVSVGVDQEEKVRGLELIDAGARIICIDVAHGAQQQVIDQFIYFKKHFPTIFYIVGNFATVKTIDAFVSRCSPDLRPDIYKVGIGPGSVCLTRVMTGIGVPQLSCVVECSKYPVISDGGHRFPQDICKAIAAGAQAVMIGGMLAGADEAEGTTDLIGYDSSHDCEIVLGKQCVYQGSAYKIESDEYRASEGAKVEVAYKGKVKREVSKISGGLRSSMTYVGAEDINSYREKAEFMKVTPATVYENIAHKKVNWK